MTDAITKDPDGLSQAQAQYKHSLAGGGGNPGLATDKTFKGGETYWISLQGSTLTARYLTQPLASTGESQIVEVAQDKLRIFLRNSLGQYTCTADSLDDGASWGAVTLRTDMPDPRCQAHILRVERAGKVYHLFSNPEAMTKRVRGTVKTRHSEN